MLENTHTQTHTRTHALTHTLTRTHVHTHTRLSNMEREAQVIQINIQKLEKDPQRDKAKGPRLKSALSQCNSDINKVCVLFVWERKKKS